MPRPPRRRWGTNTFSVYFWWKRSFHFVSSFPYRCSGKGNICMRQQHIYITTKTWQEPWKRSSRNNLTWANRILRIYFCVELYLYTPASTRSSAGRKLQRYWDTPVRHNRQRQRDGPRGDKRQLRLCWCSLGRQLSTHLSAGHTCIQATPACVQGEASRRIPVRQNSRFENRLSVSTPWSDIHS